VKETKENEKNTRECRIGREIQKETELFACHPRRTVTEYGRRLHGISITRSFAVLSLSLKETE
jgi:hypothetical protein